jgi:hypothetical protein
MATQPRTRSLICRSLLAVTGVMMLMVASSDAEEAYRVIVNPANSTASLSRAQLSRFFLDASTWDTGQPVLPVDLPPASPVRELFSKAVHGMPPGAIVARRATASAAGSRIPVTLSSDADVIQYVRLKLGAIGYVSAATDVSAVKVISVDWAGSSDSAAAQPEALVQGVLKKYASAVERGDLGALKQLWPTMTGAQMLAFRAESNQARAIRVELLDPRIDIKADKAVVVARRRNIFLTTSGTTIRTETATTVRLSYAASGWIIEDIRYQAQR